MSTYQDQESFKAELRKFTGSDEFYKSLKMIFTDGVQFFADQMEAFWFITHVESVLPIVRSKQSSTFYSVKLEINTHNRARIVFTDGNSKDPIHSEHIPFIDFPIPGKYKFFLCENELNSYTLMLPSEY